MAASDFNALFPPPYAHWYAAILFLAAGYPKTEIFSCQGVGPEQSHSAYGRPSSANSRERYVCHGFDRGDNEIENQAERPRTLRAVEGSSFRA